MSLATRCTACGTIFRVVEDQLRVSEGWVRCGRCAEVFDARELLFDIDREAPPSWPAASATPSSSQFEMPRADEQGADGAERATQTWDEPSPAWPSSRNLELEQELAAHSTNHAHPAREEHPSLHEGQAEPDSPRSSRRDSRFDDRQEPQWSEETAQEPGKSTPSSASSLPKASPADLRVEPAPIDMGDGPDVLLSPKLLNASEGKNAESPQNSARSDPSEPSKAAETSTQALPSFLRGKPSAKSGPQGWLVRGAQTVALVLLSTVLLAQISLQFRDALAAQQSALRPSLASLCQLIGCSIQPWRHIEAITVETSALNQAGTDNNYKLLVSLRNKSRAEVATPWVELSLTDNTGKLIAKRSLRPSDFHLDQAVLAAHSELSMQALLSTGPVKVSGYSVEIFYP